MSGAGGRTRREILADAAKAAAAASVAGLAGCFPSVGGRWPDAAEKPMCSGEVATGSSSGKPPFVPATNAVVEVFNQDSVLHKGSKDIIQPAVVPGMLDIGLKALAREVQKARSSGDTDQDAAVEENPWKVLLPGYQSGQRIGLKVNCLNSQVPTSGAIVRAIVMSLRDTLGVDPSKIIVWDRTLADIKNRGRYTEDDLAGAQALGTMAVAEQVTDGDPGYGHPLCPAIEGENPRLSRILTDLTDVTINCPVLKSHNNSGVTAAMKNIYGIIDIPDKYHKPKLQKALPILYALPAVRDSLVLTIVDALKAVTTGDTQGDPDAAPSRILLAQDPVALDNYALSVVNQFRADLQTAPISSEVISWIDYAHELKLGNKEYVLVKA